MAIANDPDDAQVIVDLLDEILAELRMLNARLGQQTQQAKVEIKTSARGADITVASYEQSGDLTPIGDKTLNEFMRVAQELSARLAAGPAV